MFDYRSILLKHKDTLECTFIDICQIYHPREKDGKLLIKYSDVPCKVSVTTVDYDQQGDLYNADFGSYAVLLNKQYEISKGDIFILDNYTQIRLRASRPVIGVSHQQVYLTQRSVN